jgi:hypothetical protein
LKQPPVVIPKRLRPVVGRALIERLIEFEGFVLTASISGQHVHLQAKLTRGQARHLAGLAKKHAWFTLREHGWKGKLWGKRCKPKPIRDRQHHEQLYHYILEHIHEGAWVWRWTRAKPMPGDA